MMRRSRPFRGRLLRDLAGRVPLVGATIFSVSVVGLLFVGLLGIGCASTPAYVVDECPVYEGLDVLRVNPAGAPSRHLRVQAAFKVCPPEQGLDELRRKHIELRHQVLSLLSQQTEAQLAHPLRAEQLREKLLIMVNEQVLKKSRVVDVFITQMELE